MKNIENLEGEIWKQHPIGIMVSNMGRVETARKGKWYGGDRGNGYMSVSRNGKNYSVHVLICEAFHDNPNNLPTVDHINRDKTDNRACNLRWADHSMQMKNREVDYKAIAAKIDYKAIADKIDYKARTANTDYKAFQAKRVEKRQIPILQLNKNLEVIQEWSSATEASRQGGFNHSNITQCCKGKLKTCSGYIWRYKKSEA